MNVNLSALFGVSQPALTLPGAASLAGQGSGESPSNAGLSGFMGELAGASAAGGSPLLARVSTAGLPPELLAQLQSYVQAGGGNRLPAGGGVLPPAAATGGVAGYAGRAPEALLETLDIPLEQFLGVVESTPPEQAAQLLASAELVTGPTLQQIAEAPLATVPASGALPGGEQPDSTAVVSPVAPSTQAYPAQVATQEAAMPLSADALADAVLSNEGIPATASRAAEPSAVAIAEHDAAATAVAGVQAVLGTEEIETDAVIVTSTLGQAAAGKIDGAPAAAVRGAGDAQSRPTTAALANPPVSEPGQLQPVPTVTQASRDLPVAASADFPQLTESGKAAQSRSLEFALSDAPVRAAAPLSTAIDSSAARGAAQPVFQLPLELPTNNNHWGDQLAGRLRWLAAHQVRVADLQLNPAELGPLRVRVEHSGEAASVTFTVQQAATRELLEANLPRLRELFSAQGMALLDVDVSGETLTDSGQQQLDSEGGGSPTGQPSSASLDAGAEPGPLAPQTVQLHYGLINTFA